MVKLYLNHKRLFIAMVILVVAVILATTMTIYFVACGNKKPIAVDGDGNPLYTDKIYDMPSNLTFSAVADITPSIKLQAVVQPTNATISEVTWSVEWVDSSYNSMYNVSEYLTVVQDENNCNIVTVTMIQPFYYQIKITATSKENPDITCITLVDCVATYFEIVLFHRDKMYFGGAGVGDVNEFSDLERFYIAKDGGGRDLDFLYYGLGPDPVYISSARYEYHYYFRFTDLFSAFLREKNIGVYSIDDKFLTLSLLELPIVSEEYNGMFFEDAVKFDFSLDTMLRKCITKYENGVPTLIIGDTNQWEQSDIDTNQIYIDVLQAMAEFVSTIDSQVFEIVAQLKLSDRTETIKSSFTMDYDSLLCRINYLMYA